MTEDALLQGFLLDAAAAEFASELTDTTPVAVSPRLLRQMNSMLNDPNSWAKRQHRSIWNRIARTAAVILLVLSLSLGALMAVSPTVRAAVINWVRETYEHSVIYRFFDKSDDQLPNYAPTWLPEGFVLDERVALDDWVIYEYHNATVDKWFSFAYCYASSDMQLQVGGYDDAAAPIVEKCFVNGIAADYYPANNSGTDNLVWIDEEKGIIFTMNSMLEKAVILHVAESVSLVDEPPSVLPEYEVTWIPEGFVLEEKVELDNWVLCTYHNATEDKWLSFDYCYASSDMQMQIGGYDDEAAPTPEKCFVNGIAADYYPAGNSGTNDLIWIDEEQGIVFAINSTLEKEVILHIAESVSLSDTAK